MSIKNILDPKKSIIVVVDMQDSFLNVVYRAEKIVDNTIKLVKAANILSVPILSTLQNPNRLGICTRNILSEMSPEVPQIAKTSFSCMECEAFVKQLGESRRTKVLLCGVEAHICISQTAHGLLAAGYEVHVVTDAISSRTSANRKTGVLKMQQSGCVMTGTEMAIYELLGDASAREFKEIQNLVK